MSESRSSFDPAAYFDESIAARYDRGIRLSCPAYDALHAMMAPLLHAVPATAQFLCAGVGTGAEILALATQRPHWRFTGVDVSADMLAQCRRAVDRAGIGDRVTLHCGRMQDFAGAASFDAASSLLVAHFIPAPERPAYFRAIADQLKPGGMLVLADLFGDKTAPQFVPLLEAWLRHYVAQGTNATKLEADLQHIFGNLIFAPEPVLMAELADAGFGDGFRFFQGLLFGAWVARKRA